jgi:hypothetical protein
MPEFDAEAFVARLERMGVKLTCVPLADGKVRINRWRMLNAGEHTQQIEDLWASQIGEDQARIDVLAAHLSRVAPPVTASRIGRAGTGAQAVSAPQVPVAPPAAAGSQTTPLPAPPQFAPAPRQPAMEQAAPGAKAAAPLQPATIPQRVPERTFSAAKLPGIQKLPGVPAVPGAAPSTQKVPGLPAAPQRATELRPAAGLQKPATAPPAAASPRPGLQPVGGPPKPAITPALPLKSVLQPAVGAPKPPGINGANLPRPAAPAPPTTPQRVAGQPPASGLPRPAVPPSAAASFRPVSPQIGAGPPKVVPPPPAIGLQKAK